MKTPHRFGFLLALHREFLIPSKYTWHIISFCFLSSLRTTLSVRVWAVSRWSHGGLSTPYTPFPPSPPSTRPSPAVPPPAAPPASHATGCALL